MKFATYKNILLIFLILPGLFGCQVAGPEPSQTPTPTATEQELAPSPTPRPTLTPTNTPTPTLTPTQTLTPTPTLFVLAGTPLPPVLAPINPGNAGQVSALAEWQVSTVSDMAWTPDSSQLAVATDERIDMFNVQTREKKRSLYPQSKNLISIAFSTDYYGTWLVAGSRWGSEQEGYGSALELWRGPDWQPRGILSGSTRGLNDLSFSPNGKVLAAVYASPVEADNLIEFLDTTRWIISSTLQTRSTLDIAFSPDAAFLATSPDRYAVKVWDINRQILAFRFLTSFTGAVNSLAYSPDGAVLATGHYDGKINFWDMRTGILLRSILADAVIESLAFSPDGHLLATGSGFEDTAVRLWSVDTGELLRTLEGHPQGVDHLLFSPDGQWLVSASYDGKIMVWGVRPEAGGE